MESAALTLAIAGGFIFSSQFRFTQLRIARATGYELAFLSILFGYVLFQIACLALYPWVLPGWTFESFVAVWRHPIENDLPRAIPRDLIGSIKIWRNDLLSPSLLTLFIGVILYKPANWLVRLCLSDTDLLTWLVTRHGTALDVLLLKALATQRQLLVTLESGKVYVGSVVQLPSLKRTTIDPTLGFTLLVSRSGYRHPDTHKVTLTTDYRWLYGNEREIEGPDVTELETFIPARAVITTTFFDSDFYDEFQRRGDGAATPPSTDVAVAWRELEFALVKRPS